MLIRRLLAIAAVLTVTLVALAPVLSNGFVNWDDPSALLDNPRLAAPGVITWAFTTMELSHYQPLSWLVWSATKSAFGLAAPVFHGLSLAGHLLSVALVYVLCLRLLAIAGLHEPRRILAAAMAALLFAVHPLRVEPVAWASAFPYVLSLVFVLAAVITYLRYAAERAQRVWLWLSIGCYAVSQLARASAVAFPIVLLMIDVYPLRRLSRQRGEPWKRVVPEKSAFFIIALATAAAESQARELATLQEVGLGARLTMAITAPFVYLWRMVFPFGLSPLDPLPIEPHVAWVPLLLGTMGLAAVTLFVWRQREERPALAVVWATYLVLLGPAVGLTPSGQQLTADRYTYFPSVPVSVLVGAAASNVMVRRRQRTAAAVGVVVIAGTLVSVTWRQSTLWRDSITLWTRAAELDPNNDIATYNLAIALAQAGRDEDAMLRYEQTLRLVPDHDLARQNLERLRNRRAKKDVGEINQRAYVLVQAGHHREAAEALMQALSRYPDDYELAHNLARLVATTPDPAVRNGALALRLALAVRDRTGGRDPRVLDTLAAAYAAAGQFDRARQTSSEAARLARSAGDEEMARAIEEQMKKYLSGESAKP